MSPPDAAGRAARRAPRDPEVGAETSTGDPKVAGVSAADDWTRSPCRPCRPSRPWPPPPPPPPDSFFGRSAIIASVVRRSDATEAAFCSAVRTTLVGSITPALTRSPYSRVWALNPNGPVPSLTLLTTIEPSTPAFCEIWRSGSSIARRTIVTPNCCSCDSLRPSSALCARSRATPPPGTTPSSTAARVACSASSTRAFFSFISTSVAAPTLITATPPTSFARRSCSFSRS